MQAANIDSLLVALVIAAIAGLSNWLQQRAQKSRDEPPPDKNRQPVPQPPTGPRRAAMPRPRAPMPMPESTLERELRRLLGEELPLPPTTGPVAPEATAPPILRTPTRAPTRTVTVAMPAPPPQGTVVPPAPVVVPVAMSHAQTAYDRAQQLHETVARHLRSVDEQTEKHGGRPILAPAPTPLPQPISPVFAVSGNPEAARQAFIASLVFGVPKGLEP